MDTQAAFIPQARLEPGAKQPPHHLCLSRLEGKEGLGELCCGTFCPGEGVWRASPLKTGCEAACPCLPPLAGGKWMFHPSDSQISVARSGARSFGGFADTNHSRFEPLGLGSKAPLPHPLPPTLRQAQRRCSGGY